MITLRTGQLWVRKEGMPAVFKAIMPLETITLRYGKSRELTAWIIWSSGNVDVTRVALSDTSLTFRYHLLEDVP